MSDERREDSESAKLKREIYEAMTEVEDLSTRVMLTLMARMLDVQENTAREIVRLVDQKLGDAEALRSTVLNGHATQHHDDHEWVHDTKRVVQDWKPLLDLMHERTKYDGHCEWAHNKIKEEAKAAERADKEAEAEVSNRAEMKYNLIEKAFYIGGSIILTLWAPQIWEAIK